MALSQAQLTQIMRVVNTSKNLIENINPILGELDSAFNGGGLPTVQQTDLDATPSLSGMTTTQLSDAVFALTSTLKTDIAGALTQLSKVAIRG